jgi:hypothetical protein
MWGFVVVDVNHQIAVRTLSVLIGLTSQLTKQGVPWEVNYSSNDSEDKRAWLIQSLKKYDTLVFFDHGSSFDLRPLLSTPWQKACSMLIVPSLKKTLDWNRFKETCTLEIEEPLEQRALVFDTEVNEKKPIPGPGTQLYPVTKSDARVFLLDCKQVLRKIKDKKGNFIQVPLKSTEWVSFLKERGVQIAAAVDIPCTNTIAHKCVSGLGKSNGFRIDYNDSVRPASDENQTPYVPSPTANIG